MKILFIMASLAGGGAEKVLIDLLRHTDYTKYEIDLCLVLNNGVYLNQIPSEVKCFHLYDENETIKYRIDFILAKYFSFKLFQQKRIENKITENYDVIVSFMEGIPVKFHGYIMHHGKKNISWIHLDLLKKHYTEKYFRKGEEYNLYQKMNGIACVSNDANASFRKLFPIQIPITTLYNPIDKDLIISRSKEFIPDKRKFTICSVGRLTPQKAYDRLMRLARKLKDKSFDIDFWLIGTGYLENELKRLALQLGVEKMVRFWGFQTNPYPYMKNADIFLSTSMTEGYPLVICEAICLGKPIVATNVTGPKEILGNSEYGLLCNEDDESIFNAVYGMIQKNSCREFYAQKAMERSSIFEINNAVNKIYGFFNDLNLQFGS